MKSESVRSGLRLVISCFAFVAAVAAFDFVALAADVLPREYQAVEYLEVTGNGNGLKYIPVEYLPNQSTKIEVEAEAFSLAANCCIFSARSSTSAASFTLFARVDGYARFDYNRTQNKSVALEENKKYKFTVDGNKFYLEDELKTTATASEFTATGHLVFMASSSKAGQGGGNGLNGRLYSAKIWDGDGTLAANLVPCYLVSDSTKLGLYDTVRTTFYPVEGVFSKGEDVATAAANVLYVESNGTEVGEVVPAYGESEITAGVPLSFTAPEGYVYADDGLTRYTCAGWEMTVVDLLTRNETKTTGTTRSTSYTPADGECVMMTWKWSAEFKVTAVSSDATRGGAEPAEQWVADGGTATFASVAKDGFAFRQWLGFVGDRKFRSTLTMPVNAPAVYTNVFGRVITLAPGEDIVAAIAAAESNDVIVLEAGDYAPTSTVSIAKGVTVRGADGTKKEDVRISGSGKRQVVLINHADALLCGVTVENGSGSSGCGVKVDANGGLLVNCIVRNGTGGAGGCGLVALASDNAYCFNCVITNYNTGNYGGGTRPGGCLYVSKGKAANCFIADGRGVDIYTYVSGPGIRIDGGTVANCTVVRCHSACDGGIAGLGGKVYNCLVWDTWCDGMADNNYDVFFPCTDGARSNYPSWATKNESIPENCVARFAINANCIAAEDIPAAGDHWTPLPGSAVIDAGKDLDWLPSVDLDGNPRKVGGAVDVGCCEYQGGAAAAAFSCSTHEGLLPLEVTFTATVEGEAAATYDWDFGDGTVKTGGAETETHVYETSGDFLPKVTNGSLTWTACKPLAVRSPSVAVATTAELDAALDAAIDGQEIVLAKGEYETKATRNITKSLVLRGATGNPEDVILKTSVASVPALRMSCKSARIESLVLDGGSKKSGIRGIGLIHYGGGTISNCVARNNTKSGNGNGTVGVYGANSLCTHCIVTNNTSTSDGQGGSNSAGVQLLDGGKASNCLIAHNTMSGSDSRSDRINAAGASLSGTGCALENCTVVNNTGDTVGGVYANAGKVVNCVIGKNTSTSYGSERANIMSGTESRFTFCRITDEITSGFFSNYAVGDFTVAAGSPLIDAGDTASLTSVPSVDLAGRPRLMGNTDPVRVDIGAYEFDPNVFGVSLSVSASQAFSPASVTFTADVSGTNGTDEIAFVWTIGDAAPVMNRLSSYTVGLTAAGNYDVQVTVTNLTTGAFLSDAKSPAVSVVPKKMLVVDGNPSAAFPYDTPDNAAAKLVDALAVAIPGNVIELLPGRHTVKATVRLEQKLTIRGGGATPGDVILENASGSYSDSVYRFGHPEVCVENLTFKLTNVNGCPGLRFFGDGGVISNCVVTGASHEVCVHNASDATVITHTVFTNVTVTTYSGGGLRPKGFVCDSGGKGKYRNCLFYRNAFNPGETYPFFWLRGTLENCTVVSNSFKQSAFNWNQMPGSGGIGQQFGGNVRYLLLPYAGATARANVFAANMTNGVPAFTYGTFVSESSVTVEANVSDGMKAGESGRIASAEELFRRPAKGDWRLRANSPARDIVPKSELPADLPATDLGGNPRVYGVGLDAGCYECQSGGMMLLVR